MNRMIEACCTLPRRSPADRDGNRNFLRRVDLHGRMTLGTPTRIRHSPVVTDIASRGDPKGNCSVRRRGIMTTKARHSRMDSMGKGNARNFDGVRRRLSSRHHCGNGVRHGCGCADFQGERSFQLARDLGIHPRPFGNGTVTSGAIARIHSCGMRRVAKSAALGNPCVRRSGVEGLILPIAVTARAFQPGFLCFLLGMGIVAGSALGAMRVTRRIEIRNQCLHRVASIALADSRSDRAHRGSGISRGLDLRRKAVTGDAMQRGLIGHFRKPDRDVVVASHRPASGIDRREPMNLHPVASHTLHLLQRRILRFEMNLVSSRLANTPPGFHFPRDMTFLASCVRHRRVVGNFFRPLRHP